jgi:hypothetical protein
LRETYILAGQLAYDRSGVVTETEMLESIEQLSSAGTRSKANGVYKKDVGFGSDRSGRLVQPSR